MTSNSERTKEAIRHLESLKPYDGWSVDKYINSEGKELVMLQRRNVPLSSTGFQAIAYDEKDTKCVVGIVSSIGETGKTSFYRGVVLVEKDGTVSRKQSDVRVSLPNVISASTKKDQEKKLNDAKEEARANREKAREAIRKNEQEKTRAPSAASSANDANLTDLFSNIDFDGILGHLSSLMNRVSSGDSTALGQLGMLFIAVVTIMRIISAFGFLIKTLLFPLMILYAMQSAPSTDTFDAKKELKRVLRGHHLPEGHEAKPSNDWFSKTVARVTATVATEAMTALGMEVSFYPIVGICTFASINVPSIETKFFWIGMFGSWKYLVKKGKGEASTPTASQQR
jgi:hypothetical protein